METDAEGRLDRHQRGKGLRGRECHTAPDGVAGLGLPSTSV
ncbi:hypothetical protein [Nonomuraea rubra]|uniref:Uncharacterized protein n=1 Tax=Nonomuraea rubra TaxID=46180 RepID=A0A7X0NP63_9ACTN|nr:hypothetical protein [Nonomuraea rubra]MBB6547083.1 hypothetical protein [Nonomuraea rubra]